jgi:hypothetical protein
MIKKSIHVWAVLLLAFAVVFSACEGPAGPAGPGSGEGWKDPGVTFTADVSANDLAIAFALSATVTVDGAEVAGVVPNGKTLNIKGAVDVGTDNLTVENGGVLRVLNQATLTVLAAQALIVEPTANVQVNGGGALAISEALGIVGTSVDLSTAAIQAKSIGNGYTNAHGDAGNYGSVIFASGAKLIATASAAVTAEAFLPLGVLDFTGGAFNISSSAIGGYINGNILNVSGALTVGDISSFNEPTVVNAASLAAYTLATLPADLTLNIVGAAILTGSSNAVTIAGALNVGGDVTTDSGGAKVTVTGTLDVDGSYTVAVNKLIAAQYFDGAGTITLGTLNVTGATGATSFEIKAAASVAAEKVDVISANSADTTLTITGQLTVSDEVTITKASNAPVLNGDGTGRLIFGTGAKLTGTGTATASTAFPNVTSEYAEIIWVDTTYTFASGATFEWSTSKWVKE